jgi:prepilin signal peptidase PulO-like enzyme (type II secretory pathway)
VGALVSAGLLFAIVFMTRGRGMGMGDVRLALVLGAVAGWYGPGRGRAVPRLRGRLGARHRPGPAKGKVERREDAFGPTLIAGAFIAVLWGGNMWHWYRGLMGL